MADQTTTIPKGWKMTTLGEVAEIIMGQSPSGESYNQNKDGLPFYQGITEFGDKYVDIKTYTNQPTKIIEENSILFSVRAPVGKINFTKHKACIGRGNAGLKMKNGQQDFLYFLLKKYEKAFLSNTTGTVFDSISGGQLRGFEILIPEDREEQRAIASVLSSLDDKIELLREENKTLEAIAQAIFKEWFVNFNFPNKEGKPYKASGGKMIDSELGEIPEGWRVDSLSNIADFLNGLALQKFPPESLTEYLPVIKIRELSTGVSVQTDRASARLDKKYIVEDGDILFSWSGSLVVDVWKYGKGALNQHLFKVTSKDYPKWFYYYWTKEHLASFQQIATAKAVTMGHIQRHHLDYALVLIPGDNFLQTANAVFEPMLNKFINNNSQIQTLSTLRDTLLPKLMKGEIRVKGFEE